MRGMARVAGSMLLAGALVLAWFPSVPLSPHATAAEAQPGTVTVEWLGWNFYRLTSPTGKVILTNPFVNNPDAPLSLDDIRRADLILVTNGHGDEVGQAIPIAQQTGGRIVTPFSLGTWFMENGVPADQVTRTGPGDRFRQDGITIRMVQGIHGSELNAGRRPGEPLQSVGIAIAFVITFENGWTLYYGGSSAATVDQTMVGQLYRPDAAILHMGADHEPLDFAMQVKFLATDNPNLSAIFPGHHRVGQQGTTVSEVQQAVWGMGMTQTVIEPLPGQIFSYTK